MLSTCKEAHDYIKDCSFNHEWGDEGIDIKTHQELDVRGVHWGEVEVGRMVEREKGIVNIRP